jgi:hypothetical protein
VDWWTRPETVSALYVAEPENAMVAYAAFAGGADDVRAHRWQGYLDVFKGLPLVYYPSFSPWTIDAWVEALLSTPLAGLHDASWSARLMGDVAVADSELPALLDDARDLQLIKPRMYGTIEFRGDPAQPTAVDIVRVASARRVAVTSSLNA